MIYTNNLKKYYTENVTAYTYLLLVEKPFCIH